MIKAQINIKTIRHNIKYLRAKLSRGVKICAVIKANAYCFGDAHIAQAINSRVDWFAVAKIQEALKLRKIVKITKPILLLGVCDDIRSAIDNNITVTVNSLTEMRDICQTARKYGQISVHIKVNTGMNRYGLSTPWQLRNCLNLADKYPEVIIDGLYTHFAYEIDNIEMIDRQLKKFIPFRSMMHRARPHALIHAASSGSCDYRPAQFDMVRVGKALYGGFEGYQTAVTLTAKICAIQHLQKGGSVGYGAKFTADRNITVGIVDCGYADFGYLNRNSFLTVSVGKSTHKILGAVCMDSFAIDVTDIPGPIGKEVTLISAGEQNSIMNFVHRNKISACLLLCSLNFMRTEVSIIGS
jgi:alanine racemase